MRLILSIFGQNYITKEMIVFAAVCFIIAILVIIVDWILLAILDYTILDISYGSKNRFMVLLGWSFCSAIVGACAASFDIIEFNLQSAIGVAIGWPLMLTRIVDNNKAIQSTANEVKE